MLNNLLAWSFALVAPLVLLLVVRARNWESLGWSVRSTFWVIAVAALAFSAIGNGPVQTLALAGWRMPTLASLGWGLLAAVCLMLTGGALTFVQRALGLPIGDKAAFDQIADKPASLRTFVVLTAGIIEELLYRGVGIGIGSVVLNSATAAVVVSVSAFVAAHFRWRPAHLIQVATAALVLSAIFLLTAHDLWACIFAHLLVDAVGFLIVPFVIEARGRKKVAPALDQPNGSPDVLGQSPKDAIKDSTQTSPSPRA